MKLERAPWSHAGEIWADIEGYPGLTQFAYLRIGNSDLDRRRHALLKIPVYGVSGKNISLSAHPFYLVRGLEDTAP